MFTVTVTWWSPNLYIPNMTESFTTRLKDLLQAAYSIIAVESHEELRVIEDVRAVVTLMTYTHVDSKTKTASARHYGYMEWDFVSGLSRVDLEKLAAQKTDERKSDDEQVENTVSVVTDTQEPLKCVAKLADLDVPTVVVLKDVHPALEMPKVWRGIRNLLGRFKNVGITLVFLSPRLKIPTELAKEVQLVDYSLPSKEVLAEAFKTYVAITVIPDKQLKVKPKMPDAEHIQAVAEASMGMTTAEADNAFALATVTSCRQNDRTIVWDRDMVRGIFETKIANLKAGSLEYRPTRAGFESVGGLENVKAWSLRRRQGFSDEARKLNLPYPKGMLLAGIKGCGKTSVAQAVAHQFGFPLFLLDVGKLFASKVGETEALTREVIRLMESLGRAVVLIDELEKSLGSAATSGGGDSGTSSRMFGTLVSWMSLKTCPVFIIGTLNNFEVLPSELIRKGRFDEVWWIDLPTSEERIAIFNALLLHKFKLPTRLEAVADPLIEATRDFSGAEIESVIEEALYGLLESPKPEPHKLHRLMIEAAHNITPQAQIDPESVTRLREKARAFKPASAASDDKPIALAPARARRKVNLTNE